MYVAFLNIDSTRKHEKHLSVTIKNTKDILEDEGIGLTLQEMNMMTDRYRHKIFKDWVEWSRYTVARRMTYAERHMTHWVNLVERESEKADEN